MPTRTLHGTPASPGLAGGVARILVSGVAAVGTRNAPTQNGSAAGRAADVVAVDDRPGEYRRARGALTRAASELGELGRRLRSEHREEDAEIIETGVLFALDPAMTEAVERQVVGRGLRAPAALLAAAEEQAAIIAQLSDPLLAERAADIRSLGRRAAGLAAPTSEVRIAPAGPVVLVAGDIGPADIAELAPDVRAVALVGGGATAHAAIVARSLGMPMVVGAGPGLLDACEGDELVVDGSRGLVLLQPSPEDLARAASASAAARAGTGTDSGLPAVTRDGRTVKVLANVSSLPETRMALDNGAEGIGLLRTELAFLDAEGWPSEADHGRHLDPILALLRGRPATVRLLDFGADKTPPFLAGSVERGIKLLLRNPDALAAQLRAILRTGRDAHLRILVPMVTEVSDITRVRAALRDVLEEMAGIRPPLVGAMIEVPAAAALADQLAADVDFFSFGTNDLTQYQLGLDRSRPGRAPAHHPGVLRLIAATVAAARRRGVVTEVCGEAASDATVMPLLVGLGVDELSVGAARVPSVRDWVRNLTYAELQDVAARAVDAASLEEVEALVAPVSDLLEGREAGSQRLERV